MVYLDNSATTWPKPQNVIAKVNETLQKYGANPGRSGYKMAFDTAQEVYNVRQKISQLYNFSQPENVIFTSGCTESINIVLKGILEFGDNVVVTCLEHNAVMRPLEKLKDDNISYTIAKVFPDDDEKTVLSIKNCIKPNTKLVFCIHASNVFGYVLPVEKIYEVCSQLNVKMGVDVAQSAGVVRLNLEKYPIDFVCGAGHKGLYGTMGVGFLIVKNPDELNSYNQGGTGSNSAILTQPDFSPDKFESGTQNIVGILSLGSGIDFVNSKGLENIHKYEMSLMENCYNQLSKNKKVILYNKPNFKNMTAVLSFNVKDMTSEEVGIKLAKKDICVRCGLHCSPLAHKFMGTDEIGTVRVSFSVFNNQKNIQLLVQNVNNLCR